MLFCSEGLHPTIFSIPDKSIKRAHILTAHINTQKFKLIDIWTNYHIDSYVDTQNPVHLHTTVYTPTITPKQPLLTISCLSWLILVMWPREKGQIWRKSHLKPGWDDNVSYGIENAFCKMQCGGQFRVSFTTEHVNPMKDSLWLTVKSELSDTKKPGPWAGTLFLRTEAYKIIASLLPSKLQNKYII